MAWISAERIFAAAVKAGIKPGVVVIEDELFGAFAPFWIIGTLGKHLSQALESAGVTYADAFDCNRFSKIASAIADLHMLKTTTEVPCAFGTFAYQPDNADAGHSINVAVHWSSDKPDAEIYFAFYEPQNQLKAIALSPKEIASCLELRFA